MCESYARDSIPSIARPTDPTRRPALIQSVDRAIRILLALQGERRLGITELAVRLELAPSTVHGIVKTLAAHNLVIQDAATGRYQLGPTVLRLGNVYLDTLELRSRSVPW